MKKILLFGLVCAGVGIIALSSSCQKNYDALAYPGQDTTKNTFRGSFTAVVDGVAFSAENKYAHDTTISNIRTITVSGVMDSYDKDPKTNQSIAFTISDYKGPGSYYISPGVAGIYVNQVNGTYTTYIAKAADSANVITITNDAGTIDGTLNFAVAPNGLGTSDNHNVATGVFSVPK